MADEVVERRVNLKAFGLLLGFPILLTLIWMAFQIKQNHSEQDIAASAADSAPIEASQAATPDQRAPAAVSPDPSDILPTYTVSELYELFRARKGEQPFIGKKIRLIGNIDYAGEDDVVLSHNREFLEYFFDIVGFSDSELNALKEGDNVVTFSDN